MSEYYIKQPDSDDARGPLTLEQLISLADTSMVSETTLLYDEISEKWKPMSSYTDLLPIVFPEKRKLKLNKRETAPTESEVTSTITEGQENPKISTEKILAAAAGKTKETRHVGNIQKSREKAAELAVPGVGTLLLITAFALLYPAKNDIILSIQNQSLISAINNPLMLLGFVDLAFAALVFMGITSTFTLVRISASISCGLVSYTFWAWENPFIMSLAIMMSIGLFLSTIATRYLWMLFALCLGIIGATTISYAAIAGWFTY